MLPTSGTVAINASTPKPATPAIPISGNTGLQLGTSTAGIGSAGSIPVGTGGTVSVNPAVNTGGTAVTPAVTPAAGSTTGTGNTTGASTGLAGTTLNAPEYIAGITQEYGTQIANAPTSEALTTQSEQNQIGNDTNGLGVTGSATDQSATVNTQADAQTNTLKGGINQTNNQQSLSLAELAAQIRGQHAGLNAQLGAVGAGSSSAEGQGDTALTQEQNTNAANIDQQATAADVNANNQIQGIGEVQNANLKSIQDWKNTQIATIQGNYAQMMLNINTAIGTASGEEQARLAEFGQQTTDTALQTLTAVNNTTQSAINQELANNTTEQATQQTAPVATALPTITTNPISPFSPSTSGNATSVPNSTPTSATGGGLSSLLNQQQ